MATKANNVVKQTTEVKTDTKFVVLRNGYRVSETEYASKNEAKNELDHWRRILEKFPDGSKLEIAVLK